ncbi:MAG: glycosyltransferase [Flavobacteriales bacterium]|nr:glycosyltransferase [Flavobacteriales bacterium]
MRILQLCNKPPYPPIDGGAMAMHNVTRGLLAAGHTMKVLCIATPKHPLDLESMPRAYRRATRIEGVFVDTSINLVDAFTDLVTADNYNISRFFSPDMDIRLIRLLSEERFDVVQLESLFMTPYIPTIRRYSDARIVLRAHNLEHLVQERIAAGERNPLKKPYRRFLARQLKEYETGVLQRVDGVAAIAPADAAFFHTQAPKLPVAVVPFGVDPAEYPTDKAQGHTVFFHLGSMDWLPNEEGVRWLLAQVWPRVLKAHPNARLHLAGNRMPRDLMQLEARGVTISGRVRNAMKYMTARHVMLVPLLSGGGMRVKLIEGMAMGRAVVSTPLGAEGVNCTDGHDILLGRTPTEFAERMGRLLDDPALVAKLGQHARRLVETHYSDGHVIATLTAFYRSLAR